jgi:hypothetical protein
MRSNKLFIGCGIAIVIGLVLAIVGVLLVPLLLVKPPTGIGKNEAIQVFLVQPVSGSTLAVNKPISVNAEAVGVTDIQKMGLWVDNNLWVAGAKASAAGKAMKANWTWTPDKEGQFTLMVRATNKEGVSSNSNLIRVNIVAENALPTPDPQIPVDPSAQTPPDGLTPGGGMTMEDVPPPPPFPPEGDPPPANEEGSSSDFISIEYIGQLFEVVSPPKEPHIWIKLTDPCDITLIIKDMSDNETGFVINRVDPGSIVYHQIAVLDAHNGTGSFYYVDAGLKPGKYIYSVYAINSVFQSMGNLVTATNIKSCPSDPGNSALGINNTTLDPAKMVDKVYCYISTNGVDWTRIPPGANEFITATNGKFDLGPYLGQPGGLPFEVDCWGWFGDTLTHLGKSEMNYDLIAPPKNFRFVNNPDDCGSIGANATEKSNNISLCKNAKNYNFQIIMWDWHPKPIQMCALSDKACWANLKHYTADQIDGFNVYHNFPGGSVVYTPSGNPIQSTRIGFIKPVPQQGILKPEFFIRAYKGNMESADSNHISH